ncbi:MAG: cyclic 2,3-diphosphoglycerate synthase [Desulfurococcaceae archaeon]|jgi:predicted GTPase|nr:cyclic 2,3-diphosphoglycerate synthase [Desulfurococcaceae archaeon]
MVKKVIIAGAGGRDFHNFLTYFRDNPEYLVVAFTATQIPGIERRRFPASLAGPKYPLGIPIYPEDELPRLIKELGVDEVVLSYSDLTYEELGRFASKVLAAGASLRLLPPSETYLMTYKPVIAVTAVKTGAGKSTVSRTITKELLGRGFKVVPVRHPMAYGDLEVVVQVFKSEEDLDRYGVTIEEREEYIHYIRLGVPVLAGVDYGKVLLEAERLGDVILWDGGNNDVPFIRFNYMVTIADAMRPGYEVSTYPGEVNVRLANAVIVNKVSRARREDVERVLRNVREVNPKAKVVLADMEVFVDRPELVKGRRVAVVEDSPSVTHGGLPYGAGYVAAEKYGASEVVDPKPYAVGIVKELLQVYPHIGPVIPSVGYNIQHIRDLEVTIDRMDVDVVVLGTPVDLTRIINIRKPVVRVYWELKVLEGPTISELVDEFLNSSLRK